MSRSIKKITNFINKYQKILVILLAICGGSQLFTILFSIGGQVLFHIPLGLNLIQIVLLDLIILSPPVAVLIEKKSLSSYSFTIKLLGKFLGFGVIAGALAYGNFLLFFVRNGLSAKFLSTTTPLYLESTSLVVLTIVLCSYLQILFERAEKKQTFFSSYLWKNKKLNIAFCLSLLLLIIAIYTPVIRSLFGFYPLSFLDWICAFVATGLYLTFRIIQRHTRRHTRKAVLELYKEIGSVLAK